MQMQSLKQGKDVEFIYPKLSNTDWLPKIGLIFSITQLYDKNREKRSYAIDIFPLASSFHVPAI